MARQPASADSIAVTPNDRCPATPRPCALASASTASVTSRLPATTLTNPAPMAFCCCTCATAMEGVGMPATSGPATCSTCGASTRPAALSAFSWFTRRITSGEPAISRMPVMPLAISRGQKVVGRSAAAMAWVCMSRYPGTRYLPDPSTVCTVPPTRMARSGAILRMLPPSITTAICGNVEPSRVLTTLTLRITRPLVTSSGSPPELAQDASVRLITTAASEKTGLDKAFIGVILGVLGRA